jgi:hypothetical protein
MAQSVSETRLVQVFDTTPNEKAHSRWPGVYEQSRACIEHVHSPKGRWTTLARRKPDVLPDEPRWVRWVALLLDRATALLTASATLLTALIGLFAVWRTIR